MVIQLYLLIIIRCCFYQVHFNNNILQTMLPAKDKTPSKYNHSIRSKSHSPYDRHILRFDRSKFQLSSSPTSSDKSTASYHSQLEQTLLKKNTLKQYTIERTSRKKQIPSNFVRNRKTEPVRIFRVSGWRDNYYSSLLDWSYSNFICAATDHDLFFYNMTLEDQFQNSLYRRYSFNTKEQIINAIRFCPTSTRIAIGHTNGTFQIYDYFRARTMARRELHNERISIIDWQQKIIFTGSKDTTIKSIDSRTNRQAIHFVQEHTQQVCGLKVNGSLLASGGNDNIVNIYDLRKADEILDNYSHDAAVKALSWIGFNTLVSGGGTLDKKISYWKQSVGVYKSVDTGSQICSLLTSKNSNQLVSCQGFSLNQIVVWNLQGKRETTIHGHLSRVLYSALNPSGQCIATGAGDQQLKIWKLFGKKVQIEWPLQQIR